MLSMNFFSRSVTLSLKNVPALITTFNYYIRMFGMKAAKARANIW